MPSRQRRVGIVFGFVLIVLIVITGFVLWYTGPLRKMWKKWFDKENSSPPPPLPPPPPPPSTRPPADRDDAERDDGADLDNDNDKNDNDNDKNNTDSNDKRDGTKKSSSSKGKNVAIGVLLAPVGVGALWYLFHSGPKAGVSGVSGVSSSTPGKNATSNPASIWSRTTKSNMQNSRTRNLNFTNMNLAEFEGPKWKIERATI